MIVDIRADQSRLKAAQPEPPLETGAPLPLLPDLDLEEAAGPSVRHGWVPPLLAVAACLVWCGAVGALAWWAEAPLHPADLVPLIPALALGPVLVALAWLLLLRTSRAEARRFGHAAEAMRDEAARLERSVAAMTGALEVNHAELTRQVDQLATLGDAAGERLDRIGRGVADQVTLADDHGRRLADAAGTAQAHVGVLLASLPRAQGETGELTRALEGAAAVAERAVDTLAARLLVLGEQGHAAETGAAAAAAALAEQAERIDAIGDMVAARLAGSAAATATGVDALLARVADTVDAARRGIDAQGEAMVAMVSAHHARLAAAADESVATLADRLAVVEAVVDRVAERLEQERVSGDAMVAGLESGVVRVGARLDALHEQGVERSQLLAASISALGGSADAMTEALRAGEAMATRTIGTAESLLIALDAAAREIDETLPEALERLDTRIAQSKRVVAQTKPELLALVTAAESTHDAIEAIAGVIHDQRRTLDQLSTGLGDTLSSGRAKADALGKMVDDTIERSHRFAEEAAPRLIEALLRVRETAAAAADHARTTLGEVIPAAAAQLRSSADEALRAATADTVGRQLAAIAEASDGAVAAAARATDRLATRVREIAEQTALVDTRLEDARSEREAADRDTLSRRVAQLIESLNSASIDITRAIAPDVSDSAWAAYLKGDRGVFTRRAVRLLGAGDARDVARLYDDDTGFRDQVNRYIHDFEGMLRAVLTQRDGSPLGVTLLSSDMGKLYVALAQAIERLR